MNHTSKPAEALIAWARTQARTPEGRRRIVAALRTTLAVLELPEEAPTPPAAAALEGVADGFRAMADHIDFLAERAAEAARARPAHPRRDL